MEALIVEDLVVEKGGRVILRGVNLRLDTGVLAVLGPNGAGKTTLLRSIAGLDEPKSGRIVVAGRVVYDSRCGVSTPPEDRRVGYVPATAAVYPHMTVRDNILFGARRSGGRVDVETLAEMLGLSRLLGRMGSELSSGEAQKVALARALASSPDILLLDEPFSNLDAPTRESLRREFRRVLREAGTPAVIVTHSFADAWSIGDRVALLIDGRIVAEGSPSELLRPKSLEAASYLGYVALPARLEGRGDNALLVEVGGVVLHVEGGMVGEGGDCYLVFKPDDVVLSRKREGVNWFEAVIVDYVETRYGYRVTLEALGSLFEVEAGRGYLLETLGGIATGERVWARIPPRLATLVCR